MRLPAAFPGVNLLLLLILLIPGTAVAQPLPGDHVVRNFLPKEYKAHNQNFAIIEDKRGMIIAANASGVLEFDGISWRLIKIPNLVAKALSVDGRGTVFVGSADDFGYLETGKNGRREYRSLLGHVPAQYRPVGHSWNVFSIGGSTHFVTNRYIFTFRFPDGNMEKPQLSVWKCGTRIRTAFIMNGELYLLEPGEDGLFRFNNGKPQRLESGKIFEKWNLRAVIPYDKSGNEHLFINSKGNFFRYDGRKFTEIPSEAPGILTDGVFFSGVKLDDGNIALSSLTKGVIIMSMNGKVIDRIDSRQGLRDDGVLYTYYSKGKLWLGLQNGIAVIEIPAKVGLFNERSGLKGFVSDVIFLDRSLYVATSSGVFINSGGDGFRQVEGISTQAWAFETDDERVICAATDGLFAIYSDGSEKLDVPAKIYYSIRRSLVNPGVFFLGHENGLIVTRKNGNRPETTGEVTGFNAAVRYIQEDNKGRVWLGTAYSGLVVLEPDGGSATGYSVSRKLSKAPSGGGVVETKVFVLDGRPVVNIGERTWMLNGNDQLEEDPGFLKGIKFTGITSVLDIGKGEAMVTCYDKGGHVFVVAWDNRKKDILNRPELNDIRKALDLDNENSIFSVGFDPQNRMVYFGGTDGVASLALGKGAGDFRNFKVATPIISRVLIMGDSLVFRGDDITKKGLEIDEVTAVPFSFGSIRFEYSSLSFESPDLDLFSVKLEGYDSKWSDFTSDSKKDYTNLSPGRYVFKVRSRSITGEVSSEVSFTFEVYPPWYMSLPAYFLYFILLAGIIYGFIRWRLNNLTRKNEELERLIEERTAEVKEQAQKLKELDSLKSRFFTNISHEFRTPLTLILGQFESLLEKVSDPLYVSKIKMGIRNSVRLQKLINQLLEISKIEAGKRKKNATRTDMVAFLRLVIMTFESLAGKRNIKLDFRSDAETLPAWVDREMTEMIFTNLVSNAVKYNRDGSFVSMRLIVHPERKGKEFPEGYFEVQVEDGGIGIDPERLPFIFDRFYQVDRKQISDIEGTGLGLTIVKELVELQHGTITVESEKNSGTVFHIRLPLGNSHLRKEEVSTVVEEEKLRGYQNIEEVAETGDPDAIDDNTADSTSEMILVIDDNSDIRTFINEELRAEYRIVEAPDGLEGLRLAEHLIPDLVITDIMMPGIDGVELSRRLKQNELTDHIPVIILTAKAAFDDKMEGLETGADDYLVKPFKPVELRTRVKNLLDNRRKLRARFEKISLPGQSHDETEQPKNDFISKVNSLVLERLSDENFTAESMARELGYSLSPLNRKLNALTGKTAGVLIRETRLEKAMTILKSKQLSVKEVALMTGYSEQSNFTRSFKNRFGIPPTDVE